MGRVINTKTAGITLVTAVMFIFVCAATVHAAKVQVPEGTAISVKFPATTEISSGKIAVDTKLLFELAEPIEIGGKVIVDKGAIGTAVVKGVVKAKKGGKPGKITLEFVDLTPSGNFKTSDDAPIKLKGTITAEGKGKKTLSYLFIFGLFISGGQGEIATDQVYVATVAESVILEEK